MKSVFDLAECDWTLTGMAPFSWQQGKSMETGLALHAEAGPLPARVPGSVQSALFEAGLIPDWNKGLNSRACEWVENRQWIYETLIPDSVTESDRTVVLNCKGLDHAGIILMNGEVVGTFNSAFIPFRFDLTKQLQRDGENRLQIIFDLPPRYQGQMGHTSTYTEQKPRFYYTWDWMPRNVQIGIWDELFLECFDHAVFDSVSAFTTEDRLTLRGRITGDAHSVRMTVQDGDLTIAEAECNAAEEFSFCFQELDVERWWPNGMGAQKRYRVVCHLLDGEGVELDRHEMGVGFRRIDWLSCEGATEGADPWICSVNGTPFFMQGVNWTPLLPNFADTHEETYRRMVESYAAMGCNILRVWGGAGPEKEVFYDLCDEAGLLVWQEFPLSSSGTESVPPADEKSITLFSAAARSYIERFQHHPCLCLWGGGNELNTGQTRQGMGVPCDDSEPLLREFSRLVEELDPARRYVATSPTGPVFYPDEKDFGKGLHWDVHGPWKNHFGGLDGWDRYWEGDDALLRSETGAAGASPAELIREYAGDLDPLPVSLDNPVWARTPWWIDDEAFREVFGREPDSLDEYVEWSRAYQARQLEQAARCCKKRFPRCGGFIVWMGHDSFPCPANTSLFDFERNPKPAADALSRVFHEGSLTGG